MRARETGGTAKEQKRANDMRAGLHFPTENDYRKFLAEYRRQKKAGGRLDKAISPQDSLTPTDGAKRLLKAIIDAKLPGTWYREFTFHEERDWRLDVACPWIGAWNCKIAIEVDGGVHRIKKRFLGDIEKHNALVISGWRYLRVTPAQVDSGEALTLISALLGEKL